MVTPDDGHGLVDAGGLGAEFSSSKFADFALAFTPKELRPKAQGC